jgi:hypothetical protein
MKSVRQSAVIVWLILSGCGAMAMLAPLALPGDLLLRASSLVRVPHGDCALCGMTRAVARITSGEFRQASGLNRGAVPLFLLTLANVIFASGYVGRLLLMGNRPRRGMARPSPSAAVVPTGKEPPCRY